MYFSTKSAVLKNSLHDYEAKVAKEEKQIGKPIEHKINVDEGYETKYKLKTKRRACKARGAILPRCKYAGECKSSRASKSIF